MRSIFISLALMFLMATSASAYRSELDGIQWTLTYANGQRVTSALAYFEIEPGSRRFTGSTACNRMFGTVDVKSRRIEFSGIGTTRKACKLPSGSVPEERFINMLERAARYSVNGNSLSVYDRRGRTILRFVRLVKQPPVVDPVPATRLEDKKWVLESIKDRRTLAPIKGVFINFDRTKKSAGGNGGCNVFGGEYILSGSRITITDIVSTMRACIEDGRMDTEREFFEGLRAANRYEIRDGRLFLYRGGSLLLTLRGEDKN